MTIPCYSVVLGYLLDRKQDNKCPVIESKIYDYHHKITSFDPILCYYTPNPQISLLVWDTGLTMCKVHVAVMLYIMFVLISLV